MPNSIAKNLLLNILLFVLFVLLTSLIAIYSATETYSALAYIYHFGPHLKDYLSLPAGQISNHARQSDIAEYINSAIHFLQYGKFEIWTINMWPPGFPLFLASLFKLTSENYYPAKMLITVIILWSFVDVLLFNSLSNVKNNFIKILLVLTPLYFPSFREWIFGFGLLTSESLALPFFVAFLCFFIRWLHHKQTRQLVSMAITLAIGAYMRGYFELFGNILIILFLINLFLISKKWYTNRTHNFSIVELLTNFKQDILIKKNYKSFLIAITIFIMLLFPWRIYLHKQTGSYSWQHLDFTWTQYWVPDSSNLLIWPTGNIPCKIKPDICNILYKNDIEKNINSTPDYSFYRDITLAVFLNHPFKWYAEKIKAINTFWFGFSNLSWHHLLTNNKTFFIEGCLIFLFGLASIAMNAYMLLRKNSFQLKANFLFSLIFIFFNIAVFTFFHYESRYSFFIRIYFIYMPTFLFQAANLATLKKENTEPLALNTASLSYTHNE